MNYLDSFIKVEQEVVLKDGQKLNIAVTHHIKHASGDQKEADRNTLNVIDGAVSLISLYSQKGPDGDLTIPYGVTETEVQDTSFDVPEKTNKNNPFAKMANKL